MYFAKLDENNIVTDVIVADQDFVNALSGTWVQTDIDGVSPINYAGIGYKWHADLNGFVAPQPYASWTLDNSTCKWVSPVAYPTDGRRYRWDETTVNWVVISG